MSARLTARAWRSDRAGGLVSLPFHPALSREAPDIADADDGIIRASLSTPATLDLRRRQIMAKKANTRKTGKTRSLPTRAKKAKAITGGKVAGGWDFKAARPV